MRLTWLYGCLSLLLLSCEARQPNQGSTPTATPSVDPLDSLTKAFLQRTQHAGETSSDTLVHQLTRALQAQGIDTVLYYRSGCVGCETRRTVAASSCPCSSTELRSYLYWQHRGRTFVKRLDCCRNHRPVPASSAAFAFYYQHRSELEERTRFYRELARYNQTHPGKPRFLPSGPVHDQVSDVRLLTARHTFEAYVRAGEYDPLGVPRFLDYPWRRRQWQWVQLLERLPDTVHHRSLLSNSTQAASGQ